jgi:hypothetical protein
LLPKAALIQNREKMSSAPVPSFDAYELRIYDVRPLTIGSTSAPERFLIGVPRSMIDKLRKDPLFVDAAESDFVEEAFKRGWETELLTAFRYILQAPGAEKTWLRDGIARLSGSWSDPLAATSSRYCIWRNSNNVALI